MQRLRAEFAKVDVNDISSIQQWFITHSYLSTNEHSQISGRSSFWIRKKKRMAGLTGKKPPVLPKSTSQKQIINIEVPENWKSEEWLREIIKTNSCNAVRKAIGVCEKTLYTYLARFNIPRPNRKQATLSKNPCCTYEWCYEHYINQNLTQRECAKRAGICQQAFANWLNRFNIPIRTSHEYYRRNGGIPLWTRRVIDRLRRQDVVRTVRLRSDHIHVRFRNYYWESYYFKNMPERHVPRTYAISEDISQLENVPAVRLEFENEIGVNEQYPAHVIIQRKDWKKASFLEQRVAIHQFAWFLNQRGWVHPKYPPRIIESDWQQLSNTPLPKYLADNIFHAYPRVGGRGSAGIRIIEHFFGLEELSPVFKSGKRMVMALTALATRRSLLNTHNIIRASNIDLPKYNRILRLYDPAVYRWVFHKLGITGTVLDLYPNFGHRTIACALAGLRYTTVITPRLQRAIDNGFDKFLGLEIEPYEGQTVDCVLSDNDFGKTPIETAMEYASKTKRIIHYVPRAERTATYNQYPTDGILQIRASVHRRLPDFLFVY